MRNRSFPSGAAVLALVLTSPLAMAQVFKWTDANGQVHYGDQAPPNATQLQGPKPPAPPGETPPAPKPTATPGTATPTTGSPVSAQQAQQVKRDVATARAQQCKEAKESYEKSVRAQRMFKTNEKGERVYMSVADADTTRLQLKANVDNACGP